ncbi:MAG: Nif3-like dinuclear metal center hexameric protein [Actinomycetes bacterium]
MMGDVIAVLDAQYPPETAETWDAVGLVCGDPLRRVRRVMFAVDPHEDVVAEAVEWGADLLVTHHPLLLKAVHAVPSSTTKGRVLSALIRADCGLFTAHTNADVAQGGVSDALAQALGLVATRPLVPRSHGELKIVTFVPPPQAQRVIDAMADAGAGTIGDYTRCAWSISGEGQFLPGVGSHPVIGRPGVAEETPEVRVELVVPRSCRDAVVEAMVEAHPYEEVAFDEYPLVARPGQTGLGRVGLLESSTTLDAFAERVARSLPSTAGGVRVAGDGGRVVDRVAVCGGAGDSLLAAATAAGVDVFVTADLRHHPASEHLSDAAPALVDPGHFASEWPWLPLAADRLAEALAEVGTTVETRVSTLVTDPWSALVTAEITAEIADITADRTPVREEQP